MFTNTPQRGSSRFLELLEALKFEYENLTNDMNNLKIQKEEYERKLHNILSEVSNLQNHLFDLEKSHKRLKQEYENMKDNVNNNSESDTHPTSSAQDKSLTSTLPSFILERANDNSLPISSTLFTLPLKRASLDSPQKEGGRPKHTKVDEDSYVKSDDLAGISSPFMNITSNGNNNNNNNNNVNIYSNNYNLNPGKIQIPAGDVSPTIEEAASNVVFTLRSKPKFFNDEDQDWTYGYNPSIQTDLGVDLAHTFESKSVVCCVRFSNDGEYLATGCNKKAQVYSVATGEKLHTFSDGNAKEGDLYLRSVCFSPDGKFLACGAEDKTIKLWNIEENETKVYHSFVGHNMDIYSLDYSKDGRFIVSGSGDKKVRIWDVEKKKCFCTLGNDEVGPKDGVTSVAISPDGRLVAAGSLDRIVRLWDVQSGYFLERYEGHTDSVYSVAFSPDGNSLASGSLDKTLKLWDISDTRFRTKCRSTFTGHTDFVLSVAFSPNGNWLISGSKDRSVQFWDPRSAVTHLKLEGHKNSVISVAVNPVSGTFATGSGDTRARIWKYKNVPPVGP